MDVDSALTALQRSTSLGPVLKKHGNTWTLELTGLPIFHGLSVLSQALGELVIGQASMERVDINVERSIHPRENPELLRDLGVVMVKVCAEHGTIASIRHNPEICQNHLRAIFGTLQRKLYRDALFPVQGEPLSLVFYFEFPGPGGTGFLPCRSVLEHVKTGAEGRSYLRLTMEQAAGRRLDLSSIPHLVVTDLGERSFIAGSTRIAQTWREWLIRETEHGRRSLIETPTSRSHLFRALGNAGLTRYGEVEITWHESFKPRILEADPADLDHLLKRVLLALEDGEVRSILAAGGLIRVIAGTDSVYLEELRLGRVLCLSLGHRHERRGADTFLDRMPALQGVVGTASREPFANLSIFLIHHLTAEVVGLIAAIRALGCRDLVTVFIDYAGEANRALLAPLLELPPNEFRCVGLVNVPGEDTVEGHYRLSGQFSELSSAEEISRLLAVQQLHYYDSMRLVSRHQFLEQFRNAQACGRKCLLIEDGGYLSPDLNRLVLNEEGDEVLRSALQRTLIGSVEHTRNGFDRVREVESAWGRLAFPALSIATSHLKVDIESEEVSVSILNAIENVLHARGKVLSRRRCIVLGSRGAIGRRLVRSLEQRVKSGFEIGGVDLQSGDAPPWPVQVPRFQDLPESMRKQMDLVIGVIGTCILTGDDMEDWLLHGESSELTLASGSTKTEEFKKVARWLDQLLVNRNATIRGCPVQIHATELEDVITGRVTGHSYRFRIEAEEGTRVRDLMFLSNLTPVNFLYYGVPTEVIDEVLAQLCQTALTLVQQAPHLQPRLYAVDHDIQMESLDRYATITRK